MSSLDGRVVVISGAGRGLGREYALEFARQGARVVVNDLGAERDGSGGDATPAEEVVAEVQALGGEAVVNGDDVSDWDGAGRLVQTAIDAFGRLDVLVNNAGILRDRMFVNMSPQEWDDIMRVHLRGTFAPTRHAVDHWRAQSKAGEAVDARVINTSSPSGIYGTVGQANYGAAKAGLASFTLILAQELWRYGITVNAVAPSALTRMTEGLAGYSERLAEVEARTGWNPGSPANIAPVVVWLATAAARGITGRVFNVRGGHVSVAEGWAVGPGHEQESAFEVAALDDVIPGLVAASRQPTDAYGTPKVLGG